MYVTTAEYSYGTLKTGFRIEICLYIWNKTSKSKKNTNLYHRWYIFFEIRNSKTKHAHHIVWTLVVSSAGWNKLAGTTAQILRACGGFCSTLPLRYNIPCMCVFQRSVLTAAWLYKVKLNTRENFNNNTLVCVSISHGLILQVVTLNCPLRNHCSAYRDFLYLWPSIILQPFKPSTRNVPMIGGILCLCAQVL